MVFTICGRARLVGRMIWVAALIASSAATPAMPAGPVAATVEARASVRILSAAKISFEPGIKCWLAAS